MQAFAVHDTSVDLGWSDNSGNETGYHVERRFDDATSPWVTVATLPPDETFFNAGDLIANANYVFRVTANHSGSVVTTQQQQQGEVRMRTRAHGEFNNVVIAFFGHGERFNAERPPGVQKISTTLAAHGYDVYLFPENGPHGLNSAGEGPAYDRVYERFNRGIRDFGIFGYSHGGGSTFNLARNIADDGPLAPLYQLRFAAYIDAIQKGPTDADLFPERKRPRASNFHLNIYQRSGFFLKGNSVRGSENHKIRPEEVLPGGLSHNTIDDAEVTEALILSTIRERFPVPPPL